MKKLSIEQKAKAYDEAIERAKGVIEQNPLMEYLKKGIEYIFPELKESEDDNIRRWIINEIKIKHHNLDEDNVDFVDKAIAWLKKQGEQKPAEWSEDNLPEFESYLCLMFQKFRTKGICTNGEIIDYVNEHSQKLKDILCHAWSEEDNKNLEKTVWYVEKGGKLIFQKTDKLMSWLKSLKERVQPQPKQWSEEDDQYLLVCKNALAKYQVSDKWDAIIISRWLEDKLKSLRPQNTWKPSDEQMHLLEELVEDNNQRYFYTTLKSLYEQLKKLKG